MLTGGEHTVEMRYEEGFGLMPGGDMGGHPPWGRRPEKKMIVNDSILRRAERHSKHGEG